MTQPNFYFEPPWVFDPMVEPAAPAPATGRTLMTVPDDYDHEQALDVWVTEANRFAPDDDSPEAQDAREMADAINKHRAKGKPDGKA